jgi:Spy/CpxP family protein refolding chaperone
MKTKQVISVMMGAALLSGVAFAQADGPQGQGPRGDRPGVRPPCERQEGAGMRRGGPGQEGGPGMRQGRRPEGMGGPGMQRGGPGPQGGHGRQPSPEQLKRAGATDQQLEALKKLNDEQQFKRIDLQSSVEKAELALRQLMQSDAADEKTALKAVDTLSQARAELMKQEISSKLKAKEILGAELIKKMREMGPPEGGERQGRGPRPEGQERPAKGDRPQPPPEQK